MTRIVLAIISIVLLLGLLWAWWAVSEGPLRNPQEALRDFYEAWDRAEDQLEDPLVLNGRRVVPLVIAAVHHKNMKLRRYAIGFLGDGRYGEALPVLEQILADESEVYYFRADALDAIYQIAPDRARELAPRYLDGESFLGRDAREIAAGRAPDLSPRTYWQALRHVHE